MYFNWMKKDCFQRKIILRGTVEGVGMRPALYRAAQELGLHGYVMNRKGEVELLLQGSKEAVEAGFGELIRRVPSGAQLEAPVESYDLTPKKIYADFSIVEAEETADKLNLLTPPDLAMCSKCRAEVLDPKDRRYRYAFNSCGSCGPRSSLIHAAPYERKNTAWHRFPLCPECRREYDDPADRRFHIEGISCPDCGPRFTDASPEDVAKILAQGGVAALKSVGGFQLIAAPAAAGKLRAMKRRPEKPLALVARSLEAVRDHCELSDAEARLLASPSAPIVLLTWKSDEMRELNVDDPRTIGVMLPPSPLHERLFTAYSGDFLIATSGNADGAPPAMTTDDARGQLPADLILSHDRDIYWRYDDSLAAVNLGTPQLWRRARGCSLQLLNGAKLQRSVVALGAAQKNTFALTDGDRILLSPHHGDIHHPAAANAWERALEKSLALFPKGVEAVAVDLHPEYFSTRVGAVLARRLGVPLVRVPHHYAHALGGMLEHELDSTLALAFDGNGLGLDGTLWGAELLFVSREGGRRLGTFAPAPLPGGELAIRESARQLAGRRYAAGIEAASAEESMLFELCRSRLNTPLSHAAGRLFDAFACAVGFAPKKISYESQCAVRLEAAARAEISAEPLPGWLAVVGNEFITIDWSPLFALPLPPRSGALAFHKAVALAAVKMAAFGREITSCNTVLLTGGVFQNRILTSLVADMAAQIGMKILIQEQLPPNDAGISVGQCVWAGLNFAENGVNYTLYN